MKLLCPVLLRSLCPVAPLAGAWIEISNSSSGAKNNHVAPLAGAWIEIILYDRRKNSRHVAPLAGAWIEIISAWWPISRMRSLPSRERGLKSMIQSVFPLMKWSLPSRERGLKFLYNPPFSLLDASLPSRERGLKFSSRLIFLSRTLSLPSRERGLKFLFSLPYRSPINVAPLAGAWIEIFIVAGCYDLLICRSPRGSVD